MTILEISKRMEWKWRGKSLPLEKLHNNQLNAILTTLEKHPNNWWGHSKDSWYNAIKVVMKHRVKEQLHIERATKAVDGFLKNFENSAFMTNNYERNKNTEK